MNSIDQTNRRIRVFVSSTFRDMMGERDELMTHAWPELRRLCRERQVELGRGGFALEHRRGAARRDVKSPFPSVGSCRVTISW
jgi:hypothetical protein